MADFGASTAVVICLFTAFSVLVVCLRVYTRLHLLGMFGLDDLIIVFSLACLTPAQNSSALLTQMCQLLNIAVAVMYSYSVTLGTGRHINQLSDAEAKHVVKIDVITNSVLDHTFSWPKLAIVVLLCRVFEPRRGTQITGYCLAIISILFSCLITIFNFAQCHPDSGFWDNTIKARCWPASIFSNYSIAVCSYNAALDLALAVYPICVLRQLNMDRKRKAALSCLLGLSMIACIAAVIKVIQLGRLGSHADLAYSFANIDLWNEVEANLLIVAASIPVLGPLWSLFRPCPNQPHDTTVWPSPNHLRSYRRHPKTRDSHLLSTVDEEVDNSAVALRGMPTPPPRAATSMCADTEGVITVRTEIDVMAENRGQHAPLRHADGAYSSHLEGQYHAVVEASSVGENPSQPRQPLGSQYDHLS